MNDWLQSLDALFEKVWDHLEDGAKNRVPVAFATVSAQGTPEVRTVVLRHADRRTGQVEAYTDSDSAKVASLKSDPQAAILLWDADTKLQIRLQTIVTIETGEATDARWENVPEHARSSYGIAPSPGTVIEGPTDYRKLSEQAQFAVMRCDIQSIDAVSLHVPHQRAMAQRLPSQSGDWITNWLAP